MKEDFWILENIWLDIPRVYTKIVWFSIGLILLLILWLCFGTLSDSFEFRGYITLDPDLVLLESKYSGIVQKIFIKNGENVVEGQLLLQINNVNLLDLQKNPKFQMEVQRLNLLQKNIATQKTQLESLKILRSKGYVSKNAYQRLLENLNLLQERRAQLKINIFNMQEQKIYKIYSPINGKINLKNITIGHYINNKSTLGNIIPNDSQLRAILCIPTAKYNFIYKNKNIFLQIDAYPYRTYGTLPAKVTYIDFSKPINMDILKMQNCYESRAKLLPYTKNIVLKKGMIFSTLLNNNPIPIWQKWFLHGLEYV